MKNVIIICLLLVSMASYAQNLKLNFITSAEYTYSKYSYDSGFIAENKGQSIDLGYSTVLQLEYSFTNKVALYTGLGYRQMNFKPNLVLGSAYGIVEDPTGTLSDIFYPYLAEHSFETITIPLFIKFYALQSGKVNPFIALGFDTNIRYTEVEMYKSLYEDFRPITIPENGAISITEKGFSYFGTSFKVELGMSIELTKKINFLINTQISLLEFRNANEKFKNNDTYVYEDTFLPTSQFVGGAGLQYEF